MSISVQLKHYRNYDATGDRYSLEEESAEAKSIGRKSNRFLGLTLAVLSGIAYSLTGLFVKECTTIYAGELMFIRQTLITVLSLPLAIFSRTTFYFPSSKWLLLLCGLSIGISVRFCFEAYENLPLGQTNSLVFGSPVVVSLLAIFFLKEKMTRALLLSLVLTTIGLVMITEVPLLFVEREDQVFKTEGSKIGVISAMVTTVMFSIFSIILAKLKEYHCAVLIFHSAWISTLMGVPVMYFSGRAVIPDHNSWQPIYCISMSFFGFLSTIFQAASLSCEGAGLSLICSTITEILLSFLYQVLLFNEAAGPLIISGAVVVTLSAGTLSFFKWLSFQPKQKRLYKMFQFMNL